MADREHSVRYISRMAEAFRAASSEIRRWNRLVSLLLRNTLTASAASTATVVVFIPPAVDPGEPPISINIMKMKIPGSLKAVRFMVLKPAVRVVTD